MGWLRAQPDAVCHFCQAGLTLVSPDLKGKAKEPSGPFGWRNSPQAFLCAACGSWNTTDANGRLTALPPAWVDPRLNHDPFTNSPARTGASSSVCSPSHASFAANPFCRTCQSNQSLQTHLLASFPINLPSDMDPPDVTPSSPPQTLEAYKRSLDLRYPLLCAECAPGVEEVIRRHDYKAKAWAFGHRLTKSVSGPVGTAGGGEEGRAGREGEWRWWAEGVAWRARGAAWAATQAAGVTGCAAVALAPARYSRLLSSAQHFTIPLAFASLFWSFWDPTWDRARQARVRGRRLDPHRRTTFLLLQWITYIGRIALASLGRWWTVEDVRSLRWGAAASSILLLAITLTSLSVIKLRPPPHVRLTSSRRLSAPLERPPSPSELLSSVSLNMSPSSNLRSRAKKTRQPIFGQTSLPAPVASPARQNEFPLTPESMDWEPLETPTKPSPWSIGQRGQVELARQRFFMEPVRTGLEDAMESRMNLDDGMDEGDGGGERGAKRGGWWMDWLR